MIKQKPKIVRDGQVIMVGARQEEDDGVEMGSVTETKAPTTAKKIETTIMPTEQKTRQELPGEIGVRGRLVYLVVVEEPRTAQPLILVKVGGEHYKPTTADLEHFRDLFEQAQGDPSFKVFTHPDVELEKIDTEGEIIERAFITSKIDRSTNCIEICGFEIETREQFSAVSNMNSYNDIVDLANEHNLPLKCMIYPYNRVISIQNLTYKPSNK